MSFKISGVDLVRRLKAKVPEYESMAEHCTQHAEEIKRKINEISGLPGIGEHGKVQIMPDPDMVWRSRAESCKARAADLMWLSDVIVQSTIHEVTGEELVNLGIMGALSINIESCDEE